MKETDDCRSSAIYVILKKDIMDKDRFLLL
jgi:hypothetical protein